MSDKLKKTVNKRTQDDKFKGQENRLNETPSRKVNKPPGKKSSTSHQEVGGSSNAPSRQAGLAALARVIGNRNNLPNCSLVAQHPFVEANISKNDASVSKHQRSEEYPAEKGVFFTCPFLGTEILTKEEWKQKLTIFLNDLSKVEKSLASCLMIHSLNQSSESMKCIETLCTILQNIISNPLEEKFKKIRITNKVFQEKVFKTIGAVEFLESIGFVKQTMNSNYEENEDYYYVYPNNIPDCNHLEQMLDLLCNTEPITLELYRNIKILTPSEVLEKIEFPDEFFVRTPDEIKREQIRKTENLRDSQRLKTKSMREKEKNNKSLNYRYSLIRIRLPDGLYLQGTFGIYERLCVVKEFVRECIDDSIGSFKLTTAFGNHLTDADNEKTLDDLNLAPAVILIFISTTPYSANRSILKPRLLSNIK
uniref:UBX domain-containing protein n=2 Tax=Rhodnius prolixus TaxID=13249 RepID=T1I3V8_RHOPR